MIKQRQARNKSTQSEQPAENADVNDAEVQKDITLTVGIPSGWLEWGGTEDLLKTV